MAWSEQQEAIFAWFGGQRTAQNLVVRARAGTGKTTTIIEAMKHIDWTPGSREIGLVCAFNKSIAVELKEKLARVPRVYAKTLHALGYGCIRSAWGNEFEADEKVDRERVDEAIGKRRPYVFSTIKNVRDLVSFAKGSEPFITVDGLEEMAVRRGLDTDPGEWDARWMAVVARRVMDMSLIPRGDKKISFDDMIFVPAALHFVHRIYKWVVVDEAQDMNRAQLIIAQASCLKDGHLVVVGDDRQAIYGFRGADSKCIDRLKERLEAEELGLKTTYRCPRSVVERAKVLVPDFDCPEDAADGQVIQGTEKDVLDKAKPGDVILSRTNAPLVPLCLAFIKRDIPARIQGRNIGKMLAERAKRLKADDIETFYVKLEKWGERAKGKALASNSAVKVKIQQIEDVQETLEAVAENCETMDELYERLEKLFEDIPQDGTTHTVLLSTVHKAKGLEWDRVFMLMETFTRSGDEEDNIRYVAITRSKSALMLVGERHVEEVEAEAV
jgi:superfamily I DNA/RNA helicase